MEHNLRLLRRKMDKRGPSHGHDGETTCRERRLVSAVVEVIVVPDSTLVVFFDVLGA